MRPRDVPFIFSLGVLAFATLCAAQPAAARDSGGVIGDRCTEFTETSGVEPVAPPARVVADAPTEGVKADAPAASAEVVVPAAWPIPAPAPLDLKAVKLADEESYKDVFRVLKEDNSCSRFFGGPAKAVKVFNRFARQLRARPLNARGVAIRMSGQYATYMDNLTGASYRLFSDATINSNGPFVRRIAAVGAQQLRIGRFASHTRQARALVLLHELGHLIEVKGGRWLLPNDGDDPQTSADNTRRVESQCLEQLLALKD